MVVSGIITALVGQEILSETAKSIYNGVSGVISHKNSVVTRILDELDVVASLKIIQSLIFDIKAHHYESKTFQIALESIDEIMTKIYKEVEKINEEAEEHNKKWFANWRTPVYVSRIKNLRELKKNMDIRFDYVVKIIHINNELNIADRNN